MSAVADHPCKKAIVGKCGAGDAGLARHDLGHRIEQVGDAGDTAIGGLFHLGAGRIAVTDTEAKAGFEQFVDDRCVDAFGSECHDRAAEPADDSHRRQII